MPCSARSIFLCIDFLLSQTQSLSIFCWIRSCEQYSRGTIRQRMGQQICLSHLVLNYMFKSIRNAIMLRLRLTINTILLHYYIILYCIICNNIFKTFLWSHSLNPSAALLFCFSRFLRILFSNIYLTFSLAAHRKSSRFLFVRHCLSYFIFFFFCLVSPHPLFSRLLFLCLRRHVSFHVQLFFLFFPVSP